jgi:hypothetical protein
MGHCVPGSEDVVEEELARQDKSSLRDITSLVDGRSDVRTLRDMPLLDHLVGIAPFIPNEPYYLTRGLMFLSMWQGRERLIEFMGALSIDGAIKFLFRSMDNRIDTHLNKIGGTYDSSDYIDIATDASYLQCLTKRAHVRTSAATNKVSKYLTLIDIDQDSAPTVFMEATPPSWIATDQGGEIVVFTDGS